MAHSDGLGKGAWFILGLPLVTIAVLAAVLVAGYTSTGPGGPSRAQNDVSGGQVSVKSPDGTIELTIRGNEYNRWSSRVTPEHKVTLLFTRLLAGPGDFTPGGFLKIVPTVWDDTRVLDGAVGEHLVIVRRNGGR